MARQGVRGPNTFVCGQSERLNTQTDLGDEGLTKCLTSAGHLNANDRRPISFDTPLLGFSSSVAFPHGMLPDLNAKDFTYSMFPGSNSSPNT